MATSEGKEMNMTSSSSEGKEMNMASGSGEAKEKDTTSGIDVGKEKNMASGTGISEGKGDSVGAMHLQYRPSYGTGVYDDRQWWPWLVPAFFCACATVFAVEMYQNNCPRNNGSSLGGGNAACVAGFLRRFAFQPLRENPLIGPSSATLEKMGALNWAKVVHQHQGWRLISSMWLHAGLIHLVINMLSLLFVGIRLEQQFGFVRVGIIYLLSGFGGSLLSALFLRNHSISVGASGPLFGLLGSMLSELFMNWTIYSNKVAAIVTLVSIFVINLVVGILPHADNFGHIGGFITGFLLGFVLLARPQFDWMGRDKLPETNQPPKYKRYQYVMWGAALFLLLVWYVVSLAMLFTGKNGNHGCHWCRYLNCVPTSSWKCSP